MQLASNNAGVVELFYPPGGDLLSYYLYLKVSIEHCIIQAATGRGPTHADRLRHGWNPTDMSRTWTVIDSNGVPYDDITVPPMSPGQHRVHHYFDDNDDDDDNVSGTSRGQRRPERSTASRAGRLPSEEVRL